LLTANTLSMSCIQLCAQAYYRKGVACLAIGGARTADAVGAFQDGAALEPDNAVWKTQLAKAKAALSSGIASSTTTSTRSSTPAAAPVSKVSPATTVKKTSTKNADSSETIAEAEASRLRGYKITADGRKTTYFNTELTEEAKALIGDIAPKKITPTTSTSSNSGDASAADAATAGSAWNTAGTLINEALHTISYILMHCQAVCVKQLLLRTTHHLVRVSIAACFIEQHV
jgi:hypothetical protein